MDAPKGFGDIEPSIEDKDFINLGGGDGFDEPAEPPADPPALPDGVELGKPLPDDFKADELPDNLMVGDDGNVVEKPAEKPPEEPKEGEVKMGDDSKEVFKDGKWEKADLEEGDTREAEGKKETWKDGKWEPEKEAAEPGTFKIDDQEYTVEDLKDALQAKQRLSGTVAAHIKRTGELSKIRSALKAGEDLINSLRDGALKDGEIDPDSEIGGVIKDLREDGNDALADKLEAAVKAPKMEDFEDPRDKEIERLTQENQELRSKEGYQEIAEKFKADNKLSAEEFGEVENIGTMYMVDSCPKDADGNPDLEKGLEMGVRRMPLSEALEILRGRQAQKKLEEATKSKAKDLPPVQPPVKTQTAGGAKTTPKSFSEIEPSVKMEFE